MQSVNFSKNKLVVSFFSMYFRRLIKRSFCSVKAKGLDIARSEIQTSLESHRPIVLCANHSSWWDAPLIYFLSYDVLKIDSYCLMEKKQYDRYPYFSKFGVIPLIREDARYSIKVLSDAASFLNNTGKGLWIFPQGEIIPNGRRPFHFYTGVSYILEKLDNPLLLNCFMDIRIGAEQYPEAFVEFFKIKKSITEDRKEVAGIISEEFEKVASSFNEEYNSGRMENFEELINGRISLSEKVPAI